MTEGTWLEYEDAAEFLECTVSNIQNRVYAGKLNAVQMGSRKVISLDELIRYKKETKRGAPFGNENWKGKKVEG